MSRSPLQKFAAEHPHAELIIRDMQGIDRPAVKSDWPVEIMFQSRVVSAHCRRRDAWRALKRCGYHAEGLFWRRTPIRERLVEMVETIDIGDFVEDL